MKYWNMIPEAVKHSIRVLLFIAISGALTALVDNVGKLNLSPEAAVVLTGLINIAIAGFKKEVDIRAEK
mgnify:CR=1 FL=1